MKHLTIRNLEHGPKRRLDIRAAFVDWSSIRARPSEIGSHLLRSACYVFFLLFAACGPWSLLHAADGPSPALNTTSLLSYENRRTEYQHFSIVGFPAGFRPQVTCPR